MVSQGHRPQVSIVTWMPSPRTRGRKEPRKPLCRKGSPPDKVIPPPESSKKSRSFKTSARREGTSHSTPIIRRASLTQAETHFPQAVQAARLILRSSPSRTASSGQAPLQAKQRRHRSR